MLSSSITAMRRANSAPQPSQDTVLRDAIAKAKGDIERGDAQAAVRSLSRHFTDQHDFHKAILHLLDSSSSPMRPKLLEETLAQHPDFNPHAFNKEGKTLLGLAVQHDDHELARYLLSQGARPEQVSLGTASHDMQSLLTSWRRKKLFYAHLNEGNQPSSKTYLDRLLLEGFHDEVRGKLAGMIEENGVCRIWKEAMDCHRHDILRALLVVGTPDELRELTEDKYSVGQWIEALHDDPGLSTVLKEFPYQSAKRGKPKDFNGKVQFPGTQEPIVCRHIVTYHQVQQANNPKIKFDYNEFSSAEAIANNVKPDIENTFNTLIAQASELHLIDNRRFGQFLVRQFEAMDKDGKRNKLMLVTSTNHTMNLGLRIKENNGKKSYVAKFFDPNDTTTVTRSKSDRAKTFETQTLSSYITNAGDLKTYYPDPVGMSMIFVHPEEGGKSSITIDSSAGKTLTSMDIEEIDAIVIWHLMATGLSGNLRKLHDYFSSLPQEKQIELLAGKDVHDTPALFICMQNGHAEAITAYGELLKQCEPISEDQLINLLAAKYKNTPALFISMKNGHAHAITAYGELLHQCGSIPKDQLIELLAAKYKDTPTLFISMQNGHAHAITAYGELLNQCEPIPQDDLVELLSAKYKNTPALFMSMQKGHAHAIKAYGELLKKFAPILQDKLINLLSAKCIDIPALFISMQKGHVEAVKAYGDLVKLLPPDKQADLLLAKFSRARYAQQNGLQIALENNNFKVANELLQLLTQLAPNLSAKNHAMLQKELKNAEEAFVQITPMNSLSLQEWIKLKDTFSALGDELSK